MKKALKITGILVGCLLGIISILIIYIATSGNKTFDAPYPEITASNDPEIIARGKYLVYGPAHCGTCHSSSSVLSEMDNGQEQPLIGGLVVDIPPITVRAVNLTSDTETGIGKLTDGEIARALRYGVGHDDRLIFPVMPLFSEMSDEDLTAVISYLRTLPPIKNEVEKSTYKFLGKALLAFDVLKPEIPSDTPPKTVSKDNMLTYGKYLSTNIAECMACHTNTDMMTGEFTVPPFAGGFYFNPGDFSQQEGYGFVSPNLTPDKETGVIAHWTEEMFIARFKAGRVHPNSPMPWGAFSTMDTTDLRAIYQYLNSLEPVNNPVKKTVYLPGEKLE